MVCNMFPPAQQQPLTTYMVDGPIQPESEELA